MLYFFLSRTRPHSKPLPSQPPKKYATEDEIVHIIPKTDALLRAAAPDEMQYTHGLSQSSTIRP